MERGFVVVNVCRGAAWRPPVGIYGTSTLEFPI